MYKCTIETTTKISISVKLLKATFQNTGDRFKVKFCKCLFRMADLFTWADLIICNTIILQS